jgi:hypothetical protein
VIQAIESLLQFDRAGDPQSGLKWTHRTTEKIAVELRELDIHISANTVARILRQLDYRLRANQKRLARRSAPDRDEQFRYIAELRQRFEAQDQPIVSIDTKKKELIGNFKNPGRAWSKEPIAVNDHDFRADAVGRAAPYGIYDPRANCGSLYIGSSHDTPEFAVDNLERWWLEDGTVRYPNATELLILADGGGSNGHRPHAFKYWLQERLCDKHFLVVTVAHYPRGTSKWNPIEHRMFSEISKNWAGHPLDTFEILANHASRTTTTTGLRVRARVVDRAYEKGLRITKAQLTALDIDIMTLNPLATTPSIPEPESGTLFLREP